MKNSMNGTMLLHPIIMMIIGLVLGPLVVLLGWHTWLDDALDIYEAVQDAPIAFLTYTVRAITRGFGLRAD